MTGNSDPQSALRPPYVIIGECDQPQPSMICQWVQGIGYCYLDRSNGKPLHDGMAGKGATPVEAFGVTWTDNADGTVSFSRDGLPVTATYHDGEPRKWQHPAETFTHTRLNRKALAAAA